MVHGERRVECMDFDGVKCMDMENYGVECMVK